MENKPPVFANFIGLLIIAVTILFSIFFLGSKIDRYLRIKAVDDCGKISQFTHKNEANSSTSTYPIVEVYENCLKDKGYRPNEI